MNLLILSAGTRDKVVQYFKQNMQPEDRVIATDCSNVAPAVYEADVFYLVPRMTAPGYIEKILEICISPSPFETILQRLFDSFALTMNIEQYVLVGSTVRSYLSWLNDSGRAEYRFENSQMLWRAK